MGLYDNLMREISTSKTSLYDSLLKEAEEDKITQKKAIERAKKYDRYSPANAHKDLRSEAAIQANREAKNPSELNRYTFSQTEKKIDEQKAKEETKKPNLLDKFVDKAKKNWEPILKLIPGGYKAYVSEVVDPMGVTTGITKAQSKLHGWDTDNLYKQVDELREQNPVGSTIGKIAGYAVPGAIAEKGATKALAPLLGKVGSNVAKKAITGAAAGGGMELAEGVIRGESPEEIAKRTALGTGLGAVGDVALYGIGKGVGSIGKLKAGKDLTKAETELLTPGLKPKDSKTSLEPVLKPESKQTTLPDPLNKVVLETPKTKSDFIQAISDLYTKTVDKNNPIGKFSKLANDHTSMLASNANNASGTVDYILKDALVDRTGNKIGGSLKEVADEIPKGKEKDFWEYMSQRHNIDRAREGKNVIANYTSEMSEQAVKQIESANPTWKATGDKVTNWIDSFMREWGVNAGTVDSEIYDQLRNTYKSYFPTQREFSQLEKSIPGDVRKQFVDANSPIKKATGSERDIHNPLSNIMNLVNRTVKSARYNEVGQSLLNSVRSQPEKLRELAEVVTPKDGMFSNVDNIVTVLENGKPVYLQINNKELLDSLKGLPKMANNAQAMRKITNVYKGLITQKNPLFAIRNMARDIPTAYIYGSEANPVKFTGDLLKAGKDVITNSGNLQRYKALGGGGSNFLAGNADEAAKSLLKNPSLPKKAMGAIEKFNNLTETAPRLAEFNRVLDKTGDVQKALAAANDVTVNFARGGNLTKSLDPFVPYLNAGVQGLDKFFRQVKNKPIETLIKSGVVITAPEVALYLINRDDPDYQALDNRTKDTYFLIPKGDGTFTKIPKSRELGVLFGSLFQRLARAGEGDKEAFKGFGNAMATGFSPTNPFENNIFSPITYNLPSNKDFAGRAIVPMNMQTDKRSKYLQYDEKTTEIAKTIGELTAKATGGEGLSPKQIDYVIKSYTGVIGQLGIPAATKGGDPVKAITSQFTADPLYSNQVVQDFYDNYTEVQKKAADKNILDKLPSKLVTEEESLEGKFRKASGKISDLNKQIRAANGDEVLTRELRKQIVAIAKEANNMLK